MKNKIHSVLQAAVVAVTLAFSGASHADDYSATPHNNAGLVMDFGDAKSFNNGLPGGMYLPTYNVTNGFGNYFAFCIDPLTNQLGGATYEAHLVQPQNLPDSVKRLYETSYASLGLDVNKHAAFQLALWELMNDDSNLYTKTVTAKQYFTPGFDANVTTADSMLQLALNNGIALQNRYAYVNFTGLLGNQSSQELLSAVPAIPEADTWAMLTAGVGLIGFLGRRRKSTQTEKFA
jgi:hypothetical protein